MLSETESENIPIGNQERNLWRRRVQMWRSQATLFGVIAAVEAMCLIALATAKY